MMKPRRCTMDTHLLAVNSEKGDNSILLVDILKKITT